MALDPFVEHLHVYDIKEVTEPFLFRIDERAPMGLRPPDAFGPRVEVLKGCAGVRQAFEGLIGEDEASVFHHQPESIFLF